MEILEAKKLWQMHEGLEKMPVCLVGWVRANRESGSIGFIGFSDGTELRPIQIVYKRDTLNNYEDLKKLPLSSAVLIEGVLVCTPGARQPFEVQATKIDILKEADLNYPIQKKHHSNEFLRAVAHLRPRTNKFFSIMKIRSELANSLFEFFKNNGFIYVHSPIITANDGEGAGECFVVDAPNDPKFFGRKALLTVTGQMHAEAYAQAYRRVFTFGPTFRAEKSRTNRHLSEFWMLEAEIAFMDLAQLTIVMEQMVKHSIAYLFKYVKPELQHLNEKVSKDLVNNLTRIYKTPFARIQYREAIELLKQAVREEKVKFEDNNIFFGMNLATEHERYICEKLIKAPTFVLNYPKEIKAFYMKQNADGQTVAACDLLVPGVGELCGGSQREDSYQRLMRRCNELDMDVSPIKWYIEMRKYGYYRSAGFGLGFDRLVMYLTGLDNIRDAIPFARVPGQLDF